MKASIFGVIFKERSLEETLKLTKEIGYDGIELWGQPRHFPADTSIERAREIQKMIEEYELEVPAIGSYLGDFSTSSDSDCQKHLDDVERYLNLMDIVKCDLLRVAPGGPNAFLAEDYHYSKALHWMGRCADVAKQYNKKIVMEIHNGCLIETVETANKFVKDLNRENVGLIHDAGNMYITDTDYGHKSVEILGDKIFHVHVKDELRISDDTLPGSFHNRTIYGDEIFQQKALGEGAVDHIPLFKALIKMNYQGYLSCECHAVMPDIEKAKRELVEIRKQVDIAKSQLK